MSLHLAAAVLGQQRAAAVPTYEGISQSDFASGTGNITVTPPAEASTGHLLVVIMLMDGTGGTADTPAGWTQQWVSDGTRTNGYVFSRTHDGSASYVFTRSVSTQAGAVACVAFSSAGYDTDAEAGAYNDQLIGASVTPSGGAKMLLAWIVTVNDTAGSAPTGYTELASTPSGIFHADWMLNDSLSSSATGVVSSPTTLGGSRTWKSIHVSIIGA